MFEFWYEKWPNKDEKLICRNPILPGERLQKWTCEWFIDTIHLQMDKLQTSSWISCKNEGFSLNHSTSSMINGDRNGYGGLSATKRILDSHHFCDRRLYKTYINCTQTIQTFLSLFAASFLSQSFSTFKG